MCIPGGRGNIIRDLGTFLPGTKRGGGGEGEGGQWSVVEGARRWESGKDEFEKERSAVSVGLCSLLARSSVSVLRGQNSKNCLR